jgi:surfactin synthase thioesterase subunit
LFGHSFGALIMFELARRISTADPDTVAGVIVSGLGAPIRAVRPLALSHLDDAALLEWTTGELGGTPAELLSDERFKRWLLADLRAAEGIRENYTVGDTTPLDCPIVAIGGAGDPETTTTDLEAWLSFTTGPFSRHLLPGGHFFLRQERQAILHLIADTLDSLYQGSPHQR